MIRVRHIFISPGHNFVGHHGGPAGDYPILEVAKVECVAGRGLRGDRYFDFKDNYKGQITLFSWEIFEQLKRELATDKVEPSAMRRNIVTEGSDLLSLVNQEFEIQGVRFLGTEECRPCHWMNQAVHPAAEKWLQGRGGLRARILTSGTLGRGPGGPAMKIDAVILAGGRSSRMGRDKAFLLFEGRTLLSRQLETVAALEPAELFISIRPGMDCGEHRATLLVDRWPDAGPLAGVERALDAARSALLLVLAVDMPAMTPEILRDLCAKSRGDAGVVPRVGGHLEPLAAVFPKSAHHLACDMLRTGRHAVNEFVLQCAEAGLVEIADCPSADARFFENWNRPADVEQPGVGSAPSA